MAYILDTSFIIDLMRSDKGAVRKARELEQMEDRKLLPAPALYEVISGFLFSRSRSEAAAFQRLAERFNVVPYDATAALKAAQIRAELMKTGRVKSHVDTMIAGIALNGGNVLVTRDADFNAIGDTFELEIEPY